MQNRDWEIEFIHLSDTILRLRNVPIDANRVIKLAEGMGYPVAPQLFNEISSMLKMTVV